jgi:hypothetical protein
MWDMGRLRILQVLILFGWFAAGLAATVGILQHEDKFVDTNTVRLLQFGGRHHDVIDIRQTVDGEPLQSDIMGFEQVRTLYGAELAKEPDVVLDEKQWDRVQRVVRQFTSAANWGLGAPFSYRMSADGVRHVIAFEEKDFQYRNPYAVAITPKTTPVFSSYKVDSERSGWRVIGGQVEVFINERALATQAVISAREVAAGGVFAAKSAVFRNPDGSGVQISLSTTEHGNQSQQISRASELELTAIASHTQPSEQRPSRRLRAGDYFIWNDVPIAIFQVRPKSKDADIGNLIVTKRINGVLSRVHVLGESTTNLLGARMGGFETAFEGAIKADRVERLTLTLDPELQFGAYNLLQHAISRIEARARRGAVRRGAVTILSAQNAQILAQVGYPSFDPALVERRRVLINRDAVLQNPSRNPGLPGSSIKVFSVAAGFLLEGDAMADLLPFSDNQKAIKQAFQNAYGVSLNAPLTGREGAVTPEAERRFREVTAQTPVKKEFLDLMDRVFLLNPYHVNTQIGTPEQIVPSEFFPYLDQTALQQVYPAASHFPIRDAKTMAEVRFCALGLANTRVTTLRLASILLTVSEGRVVHPFLVESVIDKASKRMVEAQHSGLSDFEVPGRDLRANRVTMMQGEVQKLKDVLLPHRGTGFFYLDSGRLQYLAQDDPETPGVGEQRRANRDFGKSGTADYGSTSPFQDSVFVYRHGSYVIAVWLEYADRGTETATADLPYLRHPAHKLTHNIVKLVESLERTNER